MVMGPLKAEEEAGWHRRGAGWEERNTEMKPGEKAKDAGCKPTDAPKSESRVSA